MPKLPTARNSVPVYTSGPELATSHQVEQSARNALAILKYPVAVVSLVDVCEHAGREPEGRDCMCWCRACFTPKKCVCQGCACEDHVK